MKEERLQEKELNYVLLFILGKDQRQTRCNF